jgi:hypothetical protein
MLFEMVEAENEPPTVLRVFKVFGIYVQDHAPAPIFKMECRENNSGGDEHFCQSMPLDTFDV